MVACTIFERPVVAACIALRPAALCVFSTGLPACLDQFAFAATIGSEAAIEAAEAQFAFLPNDQQHTGVEDGRVGTTEDTDEQGQREGTDGDATEERERT